MTTHEFVTKVDRDRPEPLYHQVREDLRTRIDNGAWDIGEQIPTEDELCDLYQVSRITIRRAVSDLVDAGLLMRAHGRGTFVRNPRMIAGARGLTSFTREMQDLGLNPGSRLLDRAVIPAEGHIAEALQLTEGDDVTVLRRLRTGDGDPIGLQTAHLPVKRFPDLPKVELEGSLYAHLERHYGLRPTEATETYRVTRAEGRDAELLDVADGACSFQVERLTFDREGPFELVTSIMRGDRYEIRSNLRPPR